MDKCSRLQFLAGVAAFASGGCASRGGLFGFADGAPMQGFAAPAIPSVRVGIVGVGSRGSAALARLVKIPGVEVAAICDNVPAKIDAARKALADAGKPAAREYLGDEAWRRLCDAPDLDAVYNTTPWNLHVPVALAAMKGGKHVLTEVPGAFTVDECWELVETSEKTRRHCMQLENCCYGEIEMLTFNLAKLGMLGEIVHGEGAYIHDLRVQLAEREWPAVECWRFEENRVHGGNLYPTHGLLPICLAMDVNRGDRLDYLVSVESKPANLKAYMDARLPADNPRRRATVKSGDMNQTLIRTVKGKSILVQHDVVSPRPYTRIQLVSGTMGAICDYPYRVALAERPGGGAHEWFGDDKASGIREKYRHPLWKTIGRLAERVGGHGGMDFIMDVRWAYCLQQGLPLDMDVYDLATSSCLCELTEKSADGRGRPFDIPDFTRGAWRTNPSLGIVDVDLSKMGLDPEKIEAADGQLSI